jgi:hypothetical protein
MNDSLFVGVPTLLSQSLAVLALSLGALRRPRAAKKEIS